MNAEDALVFYDDLQPDWTPFAIDATYRGEGACYVNSRYVVVKRKTGEGSVWLSIHDHERTTRHDWADFYRIKNELCGKEWEAIEIYPPDSYLVDAANQYHLWCFEQSIFIEQSGLGFKERLVRGVADKTTKQRLKYSK